MNALATKTFIADVNKTITINGNIYTISVPEIPEGTHLYLNEVELTANTPVELTENMSLTVSIDVPDPVTLTVNHQDTNEVKIDDNNINNGQIVTLTDGAHTMNIIGATAIPQITVNGDGISEFSVNSLQHEASELPYTFTPQGGVTNQIWMNGTASEDTSITIVGTNIASATVNNSPVSLPYSTKVTEHLDIAISGEVYQVDLTSVGGALIENKTDGTTITDGNAKLHKIIDIDKDTFIVVDGTHLLQFDGNNIKSLSINGVITSVSDLPVNVKNTKMTATVLANGYDPSEVHVVGEYMKTVTVDGVDIPIGDNGAVDFELTTVEQNHFVNIVGAQPREYGITWNDNGTTAIEIDGKKIESGTTTMINKDVYVEATPEPIPIHFELVENAFIEINGRDYTAKDFIYNATAATEIDITTDSCILNVSFIDDSFTITVPQDVITFTAPHRDGWIFDCWTSSDLGIDNPRNVKTTLDLRGKSTGNLVANYQRYLTWNKPNAFN